MLWGQLIRGDKMASISGRGLSAERRFYCGMAIAMIVLTLIGFAPSFYFIGIVHYPRPNPTLTPLVVAHGVLFSAWMLLFAAQAGLIAANRRDLHRRLGVAGFLLAVLLVPMIYLAAVGQVARANQMPFSDPLNWTAVPLFLLPAFIILIWQGWKYRRDPAAHKRLMLGAALVVVQPAIGRLPIAPPVLSGFAFLNFLAWSMFVPLILWDQRSLGRLHWATKFGARLYAVCIVVTLVALATGFWGPIAAHLPGV